MRTSYAASAQQRNQLISTVVLGSAPLHTVSIYGGWWMPVEAVFAALLLAVFFACARLRAVVTPGPDGGIAWRGPVRTRRVRWREIAEIQAEPLTAHGRFHAALYRARGDRIEWMPLWWFTTAGSATFAADLDRLRAEWRQWRGPGWAAPPGLAEARAVNRSAARAYTAGVAAPLTLIAVIFEAVPLVLSFAALPPFAVLLILAATTFALLWRLLYRWETRRRR